MSYMVQRNKPKARMDKDAMDEYERLQSTRQAVLYKGVKGQVAHINVC
ncbi:MAG: hypothetical protein ACJAU6_000963 [Alphaproteobacteria bacterium]|jgi:hypothetical protein